MTIKQFSDNDRVIEATNGTAFRPTQRGGIINKVEVQIMRTFPQADGGCRCRFEPKESFELGETVDVNWERVGLKPARIREFAWHSNGRGGASLMARVRPLNLAPTTRRTYWVPMGSMEK